MFSIKFKDDNEIVLRGRFDASQVEKANAAFKTIKKSSTLNFQKLDYISSAGLGELLAVQKRLNESGQSLKIINMNNYIRDVFGYAGFDTIFKIE